MDKVTRTTNELIFLNGYASGMLAERSGKKFNHDEALKEFYGITENINKELAKETRQEIEKEREDEEDTHPQMGER